MRILAITAASLVALAPVVARADSRDDLQKKGELQAKEGRFAEAIESFKEADHIDQRASHACLIALAYTRRELWSQAQLWMSTCHARATSKDPMPEWSPQAEKLIADRLGTANVAEVTIEVVPADGDPKITVSSFAPDEEFAPRKIHLAPGTHVIFAKLGDRTKQETLVFGDKTPQHVVFDFTKPDVDPNLRPLPDAPPPSKKASNTLLVAGGVSVGLGLASHLLMASARSDMLEAKKAAEATMDGGIFAQENSEFEAAGKRFDRYRIGAIAFYTLGVGLAVTGIIIRPRNQERAPSVSAMPLPEGGGFVSVGWTR